MQGRDDGSDGAPSKHPQKHSPSNPSARAKSGTTTPVSLVLQFLERYGRGSGDHPSGDSKRRNFTEVMARMYPEGSRPVQSTDRPTDVVPKVDAPLPVRGQVVSERIDSSVEQDNPATSPPAVGHAGSDVDPNDMMILEASPDDLPRETPRPGDDEVMFIG
jgi:hypothetical protein